MLTDAEREALRAARKMTLFGLQTTVEAIVAAHVAAALNETAGRVEEWRDMHRRLADLVSNDASDAVRAAADRSRVRQLAYARAASIVRAATP